MTDSQNSNKGMFEEPERTVSVDDPLGDAETVISVFGGVRPMASRLSIPATTIQGWKSRGNIPEDRRQAILEAALADNLELSTPQIIGGPKEESPVADAATDAVAVSDRPRVASITGSGWLALSVAIVALACALTLPIWSPLFYGIPQAEVPRDVINRLEVLERRPKASDLTDRIAAAERVLEGVKRLYELGSKTDLTPQLHTLSDRVDVLAQALEAVRLEVRNADDGSAAKRSRLQETVSSLSQKVDQVVVDKDLVSVRELSIIVAVGALEVTLGKGLPYAFALASIQPLAKTDDVDYTQSLSVLEAHAATGIPTRSQLASRLDALIDFRGSPVWTPVTNSWSDRVLRKIDAVISIRRIDEGSGVAEDLRRAHEALTVNDFKGAANVLREAGGPAGDWARDAARRVEADQALTNLRMWALKALDAAKTKNSAKQ